MRLVASLLLLLLAAPALAQDAPAGAPESASAPQPAAANPLAGTSDFLEYHPDLKYRKKGLEAYERDSFPRAAAFFRKAARYADKPSQAMVAQMLWRGEGVTVDRPLAYAWMDLAAERRYPSFVAFREHFWQQLDAAQRQQAIEVGKAVYAEFSDAVAKPRFAAALERGRSHTTGSRTGFVGNLQIMVPGPGGEWITIPANRYYAPRFWQDKDYWAWQDQVWKAPLHGNVLIGPLQAVHKVDPNRPPQPTDTIDASSPQPTPDKDQH